MPSRSQHSSRREWLSAWLALPLFSLPPTRKEVKYTIKEIAVSGTTSTVGIVADLNS